MNHLLTSVIPEVSRQAIDWESNYEIVAEKKKKGESTGTRTATSMTTHAEPFKASNSGNEHSEDSVIIKKPFSIENLLVKFVNSSFILIHSFSSSLDHLFIK